MKTHFLFKLNLSVLVAFILGILPLFSSCAASMPQQRPTDFRLIYSVSGGMLAIGSNTTISPNGCEMHTYNGKEDKRIQFNLTAQELDQIYQVLKDNHFTSIKTGKERYYDAGGDNISVSWGTYSHSMGNGYERIDESWMDEWKRITTTINQIIRTALQKQKS